MLFMSQHEHRQDKLSELESHGQSHLTKSDIVHHRQQGLSCRSNQASTTTRGGPGRLSRLHINYAMGKAKPPLYVLEIKFTRTMQLPVLVISPKYFDAGTTGFRLSQAATFVKIISSELLPSPCLPKSTDWAYMSEENCSIKP